jgi:hypothetical protein
MELRFGHLCDYATLGAAGKLVLVGVFDTLFWAEQDQAVGVPLSHLVFKLECSIAEGPDHAIHVRLKDEDEQTLNDAEGKPMDWDTGMHVYQLSGPGRPLSRMVLLTLQGLTVPSYGDYAFEIKVDGQIVGQVPFFVTTPPPSA